MTFTLLAVDREAGLIGAATASRSLAVGNAVIAVDPAVGAVASQAWTNRALRHHLLAAMAGGADAAAAIARVPEHDPQPELRQAAALDLAGRAAAHTGAGTSAWTGHRVGEDVVALGNLLAGPAVLDAIAETWSRGAAGDALAFAARLVAALEAGEAAGGDARGRQSAAVQAAVIDRGARQTPPALAVDLRSDDHERPLAELRRLLALQGSSA